MLIFTVFVEKQDDLFKTCKVKIPDLDASFECPADNDLDTLEQAACFIKDEVIKRLLMHEKVPQSTTFDADDKNTRPYRLAVQVDLPANSLFSITEVQCILGVTQPRVSHLLRDKRLIAIKEGRQRWITQASLAAYLKTPRRPGRPPKGNAGQFDDSPTEQE